MSDEKTLGEQFLEAVNAIELIEIEDGAIARGEHDLHAFALRIFMLDPWRVPTLGDLFNVDAVQHERFVCEPSEDPNYAVWYRPDPDGEVYTTFLA